MVDKGGNFGHATLLVQLVLYDINKIKLCQSISVSQLLYKSIQNVHERYFYIFSDCSIRQFRINAPK